MIPQNSMKTIETDTQSMVVCPFSLSLKYRLPAVSMIRFSKNELSMSVRYIYLDMIKVAEQKGNNNQQQK